MNLTSQHPIEPPRRGPTLRQVYWHELLEVFSEYLIYFTVVFGPWAFGTTTQKWTVWTMNAAGFLLGAVLVGKILIRRWFGHHPARWEASKAQRWLSVTLAGLTFLVLAYIAAAALNARAVYDPKHLDFAYLPHLDWLPHSYDRIKSFQLLANYLALAGFFWCVRDWLLGMTSHEAHLVRQSDPSSHRPHFLPERLRRLLWVMCINGALLAGEGIAQRLSGSGKLLWLIQPRINKAAIEQFGPYAYRANAAQYFNLLWPLGLAFWWTLRREARRKRESETSHRSWVLPPIVGLMAICPILSTSRAGAAVTVAGVIAGAVVIVSSNRRRHAGVQFTAVVLVGVVLVAGLYLGWDPLAKRFKTAESDLFQREDMYATARLIATDYPWFGTGPGSFEAVFQLYRSTPEQYWPAQLHNDWLETRVTFGWVGSSLIALAFCCVLARWFAGGGIRVNGRFIALIGLGLLGCLAHARFDFPFQVYSILHLFLLECAILFTLGRREVSD